MTDPADVLSSDDFDKLSDSNKIRVLISVIVQQSKAISKLQVIVGLLQDLNKDNLKTMELIKAFG